MLGTDTADWISIYKSTPGRRAFACSQLEALSAPGYPELAALAAAARAHDEHVVRLHQRWLETREDAAGSEASAAAVAADRNTDRWIGGTYRTLVELTAFDHHRGQAATRILRKHFPAGAEAITKLPLAEANTVIGLILADVHGEAAPMSVDVAAAGVSDHFAELAKAHAELDVAVRQQNAARAVSFEEVRAADRQGQALFLDLVVSTLFHTRGAEREADRAKLLHPIAVQNEALRELHRARRRPTDVDPRTGVVVSDPAPSPSDPTPAGPAPTE